MEEEDIRAIAEIAVKNDIIVFSDEIYDKIMYEGSHFSITSLPGMMDRTILLNGFSKTYAMTGWRMGYGFFPPEMVVHIVRLVTNSVSCAPPIVQKACIEALTGPQDSVPKMVAEFKKRRDLIVDGLNDIPGISCHRPKGAFYVFPNIKKLGMSSSKVSDYLLYEGGVASLPGTSFGSNGEGYLRLSYATSQENIKIALEKIRKAVARL
jgi:aspartate/methionine/tyrosine aminotransferase